VIHAGTDFSQELSDGQQIVQIVLFFYKKRYVEFSVNVEDLKQRERVGAINPKLVSGTLIPRVICISG